jgi:hypothetical protein
MRLLAALLAPLCLWAADGGTSADPVREIVRQSAVVDERNFRLARNYTFNQQIHETLLDARGGQKSAKAETYDITFLFGVPYRRLIAKDGQPLSPADARKQEEKLAKTFAARQRESGADKQKHMAQYEKARERSRAFLREVPDAFNFRLLGEETVQGRPAYVIEALPRPGYRPHEADARIFPKLRGKLWIDKQDFQWIKGEAETLDTVSFGVLLFRLGQGSRLEFEQAKVNNEVWLLRQINWEGSARLALLKKLRGTGEIVNSNYRKFQADTEIVTLPAGEGSR